MRNFFRVLLIILLLQACVSLANAFLENLSEEDIIMLADELQEEDVELLLEFIQEEKQQMRELSKEFLIDELPQLIALDPDQAGIALEQFSQSLTYLSENEVNYLLGHLFARIGETDRAISTFAALLETDFDEDSRAMMGLMFSQILSELLEAGEKELAFRYLDTVLHHGLVPDDLILSYLYLSSELNDDKQEVLGTLQSYMENNETLIEVILPARNSVLARLDRLDLDSFYSNPSLENLDAIYRDIDQIIVDLTALNTMIQEMPNTLYKPRLNRQYIVEYDKLLELKENLAVYSLAPELAIETQVLTLTILEDIRSSIDQYYRVLNIIEEYLNQYTADIAAGLIAEEDIYWGDVYLDGVIQLDKTASIYSEMLEVIDELLEVDMDGDHLVLLREQRADIAHEKQRVEALRDSHLTNHDFRHGDDEVVFEELWHAYKDIKDEAHLMTIVCDEIEDFTLNDMPNYVGAEMRQSHIAKVETCFQELRQHEFILAEITESYETSVVELDFITLKLKYRRQIAEYESFLNRQSMMNDEELFSNQAIQRSKLTAMAEEIEKFRREHPNYKGLPHPGGEYFARDADLHFMLAELNYYAQPADMTVALNHYRLALQKDPKLPDRDLALYNIAFITSVLKQQEVDNNKINYRLTARINDQPPANSLYSEANFAEPYAALNEIVAEYPTSKVHEEAMYRLGLLNFSFALDAQDPEPYEAAALGYFNKILEKPNSPLYYEALYQRGWVQLNSFDEDVLRSAMDDFVEILIATDSGAIKDPQLVQDYRQDAVDNIAYCLIALDGTDFYSETKSVAEVQRVFRDYDNDEIIEQIIDGAIRNKLNLSASTQAVDLLELKINAVPLALANPVILDSILVLYHNSAQNLRDDQSLDEITQHIYQRLISDYGYGSKWYTANKDKDISRQLEIVENAYLQRSYRLYNNFAANVSHETMESYNAHMDQFELYAKLHNEDFSAFKAQRDSTMAYNYAVLADRTQVPKDFVLAIAKLNEYNDKYPNNESFYDYEELTLNYAKGLFIRSTEAFEDPDYIPAEGEFASEDEAFLFLQNRSTRFMNIVRQDAHYSPERLKEANDLILLLADTQMGRDRIDEAIELYTLALNEEEIMPNRQKRDTYLKLAELSSRVGKYPESEAWFRMALPYAENPEEEANIQQDILVQIQNIFEKASDDGDYMAEALERLRLAAEMGPGRGNEVLGQKNAAVEAFKKAGAYQEAIDLLMELAENDESIDAIYARYHQAIEIAESSEMMNDKALAEALEAQFLAGYPASNYAFQLRLASVARKALADQYLEAAEGYMQLFDEARAQTIDSGDQVISELLMDAIIMNLRAEEIAEEYRLRHMFIELYPGHPDVVPYLEYMVVGHRDRGEMDEHIRLAKELMQRDPSKSAYYQYHAETELHKVALRFDEAYSTKDFDQAFAVRDEYRTMQRGFENEGLSFTNQAVYDIFAAVQEEYDEIQRRIAYLNSYDAQLSQIEHGSFFGNTPNQHVRVNNLTRWNQNLNGGDRRIPKFNQTTVEEVNKVNRIVQNAANSGYYIDNDRVTRAYNLMAKIHEYAIEVISTQLVRYYDITGEGIDTKAYFGENFPAVQEQSIWQQTLDHLQASLGYHSLIYTQYYLAGYENAYTAEAIPALDKYQQIPDYRTTEYALNRDWTMTGSPLDASPEISQVNTSTNMSLGSVKVPAGNTLTISRTINAALEPDFAQLHTVFPYDLTVWLNGSAINSSWVPVDSLDAKNPHSTRYSYYIGGEFFTQGNNELELVFTNDSEIESQAAAAIKLFTSHARILANIPPETKHISSSERWKASFTDEEGESAVQLASLAEMWNIDRENLLDWESPSARAIWAPEYEAPIHNIAFETEFTVDTQFFEGIIDIIAPESVTIYLNDVEIGGAMFDYDPEPFTVYKSQLLIEPEQVVEGRNVLRFEVENYSDYRGFLAEITYTVAGKEEIR